MDKTLSLEVQLAEAHTNLLDQAQSAGIPLFSYPASGGKPHLKLTVESDESDKAFGSTILISGGDPYNQQITETLGAAGFVFNQDEEWWELKPVTVKEAFALSVKLRVPLFCGHVNT